MVELRGISKYFSSNGVMALENAGLTLRSGEIHALLGENGTGKSTLMHILAGYFPPSSGTILVDGKERRFSAPADALAAGIGMVRQYPGFIQGFKVWENCILGAERQPLSLSTGAKPSRYAKYAGVFINKCRSLFLDPGSAKKRAGELSNRWNFDLPLDRQTESLTVSQRQKASVLALLLRDVKWFVFDEPTAVLTADESKSLLELFRLLANEGHGIIFITHKLDEALAVSDRITVIRRGVTEKPRDTKDLSPEALKDIIFLGVKNFAVSAGADASVPAVSGEEKPVLVIKDLRLEQPGLLHIRNINLELGPGKILGITGVRDGGLETLELAVTGLPQNPAHDKGNSARKPEGSITLNGFDITGKGIRAFRDAGGACLGADRLGSNLAPDLPLFESLVIHCFRRARRGFGIFLDMDRLYSWCSKIMNRAGIARPVSDKAVSFSGGMLQRILLAREFAEDASLLVLAEPGSGLDQFNCQKLAGELKSLVYRGAAVLLFSTDMEELVSVADEIMILSGGILTPAGKVSLAGAAGENK